MWCLEVNQKPTTSVDWLNIETLERCIQRNVRMNNRGDLVNWVAIGLFSTIEEASAAANDYRIRYAARRPPEPDL